MDSMLETTALDAAFADALHSAFKVLPAAYAGDDDHPVQLEQADIRFKTAVQLARRVRERALQQL